MVLQTTFTGRRGRVRLTDALAFAPGARGHDIGLESPHTLVRLVEALEGEMRVRMECAPRLEYGLVVPELVQQDDIVTTFGGADRLFLRSDVPVTVADARIVATLTLCEGGSACFSLAHRHGSGPAPERSHRGPRSTTPSPAGGRGARCTPGTRAGGWIA